MEDVTPAAALATVAHDASAVVFAIPELLAAILGFLELSDALTIRLVCWRWNVAEFRVRCSPSCLSRVQERAALYIESDDMPELKATITLVYRASVTDAVRRSLWKLACKHGSLAIMQWLADHFGFTAADARRDDNFALRWLCEHGHLAVAQWLVARFGLTAADARCDVNRALRWACKNGHLAVAQWLVDRFGLTATDARCNSNCALRWACEKGYLDVAQWLTKHFGIAAADARGDATFALHLACENGHLAVAQWLADSFGLTASDARSWHNRILGFTCVHDHLVVVQWLVRHFGLIHTDAQSALRHAQDMLAVADNRSVRWLAGLASEAAAPHR